MSGQRVRFSPDIFRIERFGGVSRYYIELYRGLQARGHPCSIDAPLHINAYLGGDGSTRSVGGIDVEWFRPIRLRQALTKAVDTSWESLARRRSAGDGIDHLTYFRRRPPEVPRLVTTVYDMVHERIPGTAGPRDHTIEAKRATCEAASLVLAISDRTRTDLLERYRLDPDRVVTTHLGVRRIEPRVDVPWIDGSPFVLYVGGRKGYKNFLAFARALARVPAAAECRLVCFGGGPFDAEELQVLADRRLAGRTRQVSGDDATLAAAYGAASALIYPSLYEGFGLPPLEAMVHGCPVAAADAGSVPEIVGPAAALFDPEDEDAMAHVIEQVLVDDELRRRLVDAGHDRAVRFTWEAMVDATLGAYRRVGLRTGARG